MDKATSWALEQLDKMPAVPVPMLVGIVIIALWVYPTIRRALKSDVERTDMPPEAVPVVKMKATGIYTMLTNIEIAIGDVQGALAELSAKVAIIDKMLRRRSRK